MEMIFLLSQIVLGSLVVILVLIQPKGSGLGRAFGGGSTSFAKRGVEKVVFRFTFVVVVLFLLVSILSLVL